MEFVYITGNADLMTKEKQENTIIRCGPVDPNLVYECLYGRSPTEDDLAVLEAAMKEVEPQLTRCQHGLMSAEFGKHKTTIAKLKPTPTNASLFENPAGANAQLLVKALDIILSALH